MRLPLIPPSDLTAEQKPLYETMSADIKRYFGGFKAIAENGALMGPWNPWLHEPTFGKPIWELTLALSRSPSLPRPVREVAILVTGARFHSAYELYAHVLVAEQKGLPAGKLSMVVGGQRRVHLRNEAAAASDVASALVQQGVLTELTYREAVAACGKHGGAERIFLVGLYCLVSVTLNGFDV